MSYSNYSAMINQLSSATHHNDAPQLDDIVNYKKEYIKGTLESLGGMSVGQKALEATKALRAKIKGVNMSKY